MTPDEINIAIRNAAAQTQALRHSLSRSLSPLLVEVIDENCDLDAKVAIRRLAKIKAVLEANGIRIDL